MRLYRGDTPIRRLRAAWGFSREAMAAYCGITPTTLAGYEQDYRHPQNQECERLARLLQLPTEALWEPYAYLEAHPNFLPEQALTEPLKRGRPRRS